MDASGKQVASFDIAGIHAVPGGETQTAQPEITLPKVARWSAETPNLYTLLLTLKDDRGAIVEVQRCAVGFRRVEMRDAQLLVNGQAIYFKGVNRHEHDPNTGHYVSLASMVEDATLMKRFNVNAVRTCHYPDAAAWYDLCDRFGLYGICEANIESHGMGYGPESLAHFPSWQPAYIDRTRRMVENVQESPLGRHLVARQRRRQRR